MKVLLDTGPLVALLDRRESHHQWAVDQIKQLVPPLITCGAVLSEAFFLLRGTEPPLTKSVTFSVRKLFSFLKARHPSLTGQWD